MGHKEKKRFPTEPLILLLELEEERARKQFGQEAIDRMALNLSAHRPDVELKVCKRQLERLLGPTPSPSIHVDLADVICMAFDYHPVEVWGEQWAA